MINEVNRAETTLGPLRPASPDVKDGTTASISSSTDIYKTVVDGKLVTTTSGYQAFDTQGRIFLDDGVIAASKIELSGTIAGEYREFTSPDDYTLISTNRVVLTYPGQNYATVPSVEITGGGGQKATAEAVLNAGVRTIEVLYQGSGYTTRPTVTITGGGGAGAAARAEFNRDGVVTGVTMTSWGSGYSSAPTVEIIANPDGEKARAKAHILGHITDITITDGGSDYVGEPQLTITSNSGTGAEARAFVNAKGKVIGLAALEKHPDTSIDGEVWLQVVKESVAPSDVPEKDTSERIDTKTSTVTLNGQTRTVTKTEYFNDAAEVASAYPLRVIMFIPPEGEPTLLQRVFVGQISDGYSPPQPFAATTEAALNAAVNPYGGTNNNEVIRVSSSSFPLNGPWPSSGGMPKRARFAVNLGHDEESNPFVHRYHPDHDNFDAHYEDKLPSGQESFKIDRAVTFTFHVTEPSDPSEDSFGLKTLTGSYDEYIRNLRSDDLYVSGPFTLHRVSTATTLLEH
jgi:hypothetical protein